ncbi:hypothetical protein COOONC_25684 [Cooperia oncophora]
MLVFRQTEYYMTHPVLRQLLDYLSVDCRPVAVYRMGALSPTKIGFLKLSFLHLTVASLVVKRAPLLRYFHVKGIYIRPSLTKVERERLRAQRSMRPASDVSPNKLDDRVQVESLSVAEKVQETWLKLMSKMEPLLGDICASYEIFRCDRPRIKGGGVALLESIPKAYEILACDLTLGTGAHRIIIVYRTPKCNTELK